MFQTANLGSIRKPAGSSAAGGRPGWVVVHDAARDQYQIPYALSEGGILERFVTDWFTPLDRELWRYVASSRLGRSMFGIQGRFRREIPPDKVTDQKVLFFLGLLRRKLLREPFQDEVAGASAGRLAARIANRLGAPLLATSYSGAGAFSCLNPGLLRVLFQVHPHPRFLRKLYSCYMQTDSDFAGLAREPESQVSESKLRLWERESADADFVLCASQFSKRSLVECGIPASRIAVLPYGVDTDLFQMGMPESNAPFTALFVGQKNARKGLPMLLRAWKELAPTEARLVVAGGHLRDAEGLDEFDGVYEEQPRMNIRQLISHYQNADVFVLPSVAEGFGHVYLEALSCGVPIICTENTGGPDLIEDGESGWILPAGNREALRDRLAWCLAHRKQLREMREAARTVAEQYTWARFRAGLRKILQSIPAGTSGVPDRIPQSAAREVLSQATEPKAAPVKQDVCISR